MKHLIRLLLIFPLFLLFQASSAYAADPGLYVVTNVVNDNGNTWNPSDFNVHVKSGGQDIGGSPTPGKASPGTFYSNAVGSFNVSEDALGIYTLSYSGDCDSNGNVSVAAGESKTCILVNNDMPPRLRVVTQVINNGGGTANPPDFNIHVKIGGADLSGSPTPGVGAPGRTYEVGTGTYVVSEDNKSQYVQSFSGDCDSNGTVTLGIGEEKVCTIINTFNPSLSAAVPRFPNTGSVLTNGQVCLNASNAPWFVAGIALIVALVCLAKDKWLKRPKQTNAQK